MQSIVHIEFTVVRDYEGRACCRNEQYDRCHALLYTYDEDGDPDDPQCGLGCITHESTLGRIFPSETCPVLLALGEEAE